MINSGCGWQIRLLLAVRIGLKHFFVFFVSEKNPQKAADRNVSKLGDVMCICGLAVDFYEDERDDSKKEKYIEIMKDAAKTAKLHYSTDYKVFMENALLEKGLDFSTPAGRLCNPGFN